MANARPEISTSFDEDSPVDELDEDKDDIFSNGKQNGGPPTRSVDRYGFIGGDHYTSPEDTPQLTLEMIRKREVKWIDMFENWEKWMTKRFKKVKARCRKGIPPSLRARAWQHLCGSSFLMSQNAGKFDEYLSKAGDPKWIEDIKKDLHRQFPLHEIFAMRGGHGQEDLFRILKAYTIHNPQEGYCQAQGPIAAVLLMHMPAEQAFWCLVSICEKYLPGYYSLGLEAVHIDGDVLFGLLKKSSPTIYKHLKKQRIEPILYMTEWFMCIFSRTLPWTAVLRVWDMFFCEGVKVMFRIALILFKLTLGTPGKLSECPSLYETMDKLKHIPHQMLDGDFIAKESLKLNIDEKDMEKEHQRQITKRRNLREKALKEASATKGKKEKKKLLGKLTKKDSESKLMQQPSANVTLISSQKLPAATQKPQPRMVLPISASFPTVGQMTTATTATTNTTTTSNPQRWSADLDAHSNINSHVLYASQISTEDESQRSAEQLSDQKFVHDKKPQIQETLAPMHSKSVLVPAEEIRQQVARPAMIAPRVIEVLHTSTAEVSEAVPARVLPIHFNEPVEVVTASEAATALHIEGVLERTLANARHASDAAVPEIRMAMPQPESQAGVNSNAVHSLEGDDSQTSSHTSQSDPMHSDPVQPDLVAHAVGVQSDATQPKPKSKSKSRSKSKSVKIELVHADASNLVPARGVTSTRSGSNGDSGGARPRLSSFEKRTNSSGMSSLTCSSKSTVTRRTKTCTTEEERTSTKNVRKSMETEETTVTSTTTMSSTSNSSWKERQGSGDAPADNRPHSAAFNNFSEELWNNSMEGTPVDSLRSTTLTTNIATTTSAKNTSSSTTTTDATITNSPTDIITNDAITAAAAATLNNNNVTTANDKDATSPKTPNALPTNCDAASSGGLAAHGRLSEEDMMSLRESRL